MMTNVIEIQPTDYDAIRAVDQLELEHPDLDVLLDHERRLSAVSVRVDPISGNCHTTYTATHNSGRRPLRVINLIILHATQGGTARGNAAYFHTAQAGGSTQLVVDDVSCYRCLSDAMIPWGAKGANYNGFHIEQCGYAEWKTALWSKTHRKTLMRAAYKTAYHCRKYGISPRFLTSTNLRAGMRNGISTHVECTKAFGGTHTDPGANWPRKLFMTMVKGYYKGLWRVKKVA